MITRTVDSPSRCRSGVALVEMAFVLPIALMFIFGILEYGRLMYFFHVSQNAVTAGARFAVVRTGDSDITLASIQDEVDRNLFGAGTFLTGYSKTTHINAQNVNPATLALVSSSWNDAPFSGAIMVSLNGNYNIIVWQLLNFNSPTLPVKIRSIMSSEAN